MRNNEADGASRYDGRRRTAVPPEGVEKSSGGGENRLHFRFSDDPGQYALLWNAAFGMWILDWIRVVLKDDLFEKKFNS